mmetsp:Transcript_88677/g.170654  ORF Transcript_88677/g.170654 Transcript_88677/m.170654 type:complete len:436 (-) Transcript_88677:56-1363(-)
MIQPVFEKALQPVLELMVDHLPLSAIAVVRRVCKAWLCPLTYRTTLSFDVGPDKCEEILRHTSHLRVAHLVLKFPLFGNIWAHQVFLSRFLAMHPELSELSMDGGKPVETFFDFCPDLLPTYLTPDQKREMVPLDEVVRRHSPNLRKLRVGYATDGFDAVTTSCFTLLRDCRHLEYFDAFQFRLDGESEENDGMRRIHSKLTFAAFELNLDIGRSPPCPLSSLLWPCLRDVSLTLMNVEQLPILAEFLFGLPMLQALHLIVDSCILTDSEGEQLHVDSWLSGLDGPRTIPQSLEELDLTFDIAHGSDSAIARGVFRQFLGMHFAHSSCPKLKSVCTNFTVRYCHPLVDTNFSLKDLCAVDSEVLEFLGRHRHLERVSLAGFSDTVRASHAGSDGYGAWVECGERRTAFQVGWQGGNSTSAPSSVAANGVKQGVPT